MYIDNLQAVPQLYILNSEGNLFVYSIDNTESQLTIPAVIPLATPTTSAISKSDPASGLTPTVTPQPDSSVLKVIIYVVFTCKFCALCFSCIVHQGICDFTCSLVSLAV
jgi:hypothetical protein